MNILNFSIHAFVFGTALLLGTTAVVASRFVITSVSSFTKPSAATEIAVVPAAEAERVVGLPDLRNESQAARIDDFDPSGSYSLDPENVPAAFADIEFIHVETREYLLNQKDRIYAGMQIVPVGSLKAKRDFEFARIAVNHREISFETSTQGGISYQFVGHFPVSAEYIICEGCEYPADLKGQLKKLKNGKVIAETEAEFYVHGC